MPDGMEEFEIKSYGGRDLKADINKQDAIDTWRHREIQWELAKLEHRKIELVDEAKHIRRRLEIEGIATIGRGGLAP